MNRTEDIQHCGDKLADYNTGLAKVVVSAPQTHLWLIKVWFSALTFVVKIATFAKPETFDITPLFRPFPQHFSLLPSSCEVLKKPTQDAYANPCADRSGHKHLFRSHAYEPN